MKPVKIEHVRCGEYDGDSTVVWVPDSFTRSEVQFRVNNAMRAYMEAMRSFKAEPPNNATPYSRPEYEKYPHQTVAAVRAKWEEDKAIYKEWEDENRNKGYSNFSHYLAQEGLTPFWNHFDEEEHPERVVTCDWGHNHGIAKNYEDTQVDQWPSIKEMHDAIERTRNPY